MKTIKLSVLFFILFLGLAAIASPVFVNDNAPQLSIVSAFGGGGGEGGGGGGEGGGDGCGGCGSGGDTSGGGGGDTIAPPVCDINVDLNLVEEGQAFRVSWNGTPAYNTTFRVNGSVQDASDAASYTWPVGRTNPIVFTMTGNNGGGSCTDTVRITLKPAPTPTCDAFAITQSTVAPNANLTFNWGTTNVNNASINNGIGSVSVDGSNRTYSAPSTPGSYTYILTFDGKTSHSCRDTVVVEAPVVHAPVCVEFTANPTEIVKGESVMLNWEVVNAVTLGLNNGIGDVTGTTAFGPVSPITDTVYVLDVFGVDGTKDKCEAPVTVTDPVDPTDPAITIIKRDAIDKDDTQAVTVGGTANFEIVVTNTGDEDLVNVVVTDPLEPACGKTIGSLAIGASDTYTCNSTNVLAAFTNVANVTGDSAVDGETVTDTDPTNVTITTSTPVLSCSDISLSASDTSVPEGSNVTLNWVSTGNVGSVSIDNGIGSVNLTDSRTVRVDQTTTYNFTINGFNDSQNCPITISTTTGGGGGGSSSPRCELEISDTKINRGDEITLTWDSTRARELILTDDRGNVIVTTEDKLSDDKEEFFEGEITLSPTRDTEYTLRVERGSRDRECTVDVEMEDDEVVLLQTRDQAPLVTGISLTEVPYTGFEAGTVMTFMFYTLLVAWALYITYVLVIPKTMLTAAPVLVTPRTTSDLMTSAENIRPDVFATLPTKSVVASSAQTAPAPANLPVAQTAPVAFVADAVEADTATTATEVENEAHLHQALLSSGAVQSLIAMTTDADRSQTLTKVITDAKGAYPLEDGWVVINQTRLTELTATPAPTPAVEATTAVTGNGSLAEAIVTGNVVAAYELIGDRPMFALADASADLDALYRNRKGATEQVSDLLTAATKDMADPKIADMINALTGAIDGTYTDEASAVKMAIMKAVKIAV